MALTSEQKTVVQTTFDTVAEDAAKFSAAFYEHLFLLNPDLRKLFNRNMEEQGDLLVRMLTVVVRGLDYIDDLLPAVEDMGLHHKGYGVKAEDYQTFTTALKQTLSESLGAQYTPQVDDSWTAFMTMLVNTALEGAAAG